MLSSIFARRDPELLAWANEPARRACTVAESNELREVFAAPNTTLLSWDQLRKCCFSAASSPEEIV